MDKVHSINCKQNPNKQGTYDTRKQRKDHLYMEYKAWRASSLS
jgi:hypothetical protein